MQESAEWILRGNDAADYLIIPYERPNTGLDHDFKIGKAGRNPANCLKLVIGWRSNSLFPTLPAPISDSTPTMRRLSFNRTVHGYFLLTRKLQRES